MIEAVRQSETSINVCFPTWCSITGDLKIHFVVVTYADERRAELAYSSFI